MPIRRYKTEKISSYGIPYSQYRGYERVTQKNCPDCKGTGNDGHFKCSRCEGHGWLYFEKK
jgi:DnaJ-class molecular chaperone